METTVSEPLVVGQRAPTLKGQPVFGLPVETGAGTPMAVLFLRDLAGSTSRATVGRVHSALGKFEAQAIPVVALTRTPLEDARDFVPRYHVLFPVIVDETGEHFAAWSVKRDKLLLGTLTRMRPATLKHLVSSMSAGRGLPRGGLDILPAYFGIKADGTVAYARYAESVLEQPDMDSIWDAISDGTPAPPPRAAYGAGAA